MKANKRYLKKPEVYVWKSRLGKGCTTVVNRLFCC